MLFEFEGPPIFWLFEPAGLFFRFDWGIALMNWLFVPRRFIDTELLLWDKGTLPLFILWEILEFIGRGLLVIETLAEAGTDYGPGAG